MLRSSPWSGHEENKGSGVKLARCPDGNCQGWLPETEAKRIKRLKARGIVDLRNPDGRRVCLETRRGRLGHPVHRGLERGTRSCGFDRRIHQRPRHTRRRRIVRYGNRQRSAGEDHAMAREGLRQHRPGPRQSSRHGPGWPAQVLGRLTNTIGPCCRTSAASAANAASSRWTKNRSRSCPSVRPSASCARSTRRTCPMPRLADLVATCPPKSVIDTRFPHYDIVPGRGLN